MKYGNVNVWTFPIIFLLLCSSRISFELFFQAGILGVFLTTPVYFISFYQLQVFYLHGGLSLSLNTLDNIWSLDCLHRRCHTKDVEIFSKYKFLKVTLSSMSASTS
ncbi:hypothetical protein N665_1573s0016 [Sinapis alba]|nr:hypothetical protein N665_1573s0016 [Sinapis alba]